MVRTKVFPILYGQDSIKRIKTWHTSVVESNDNTAFIITNHGLETGRKIVTKREISSGKNIGKSNQTTAYDQA